MTTETRFEKTKDNELPAANTQHPITLRLVAVFAIVLIALPLMPALIANLAYSFSGHAPKIYWYLSRAGGFISLSILWVSMAMGLGLTNKLARLWPGAPAAFAVHEYVSLLGLIFAVYHALVLIGDHYVDFSLPRLLVPFSIQYEPFWVGLGQTAFYAWVIVLLSFYIRQYIGQKTWRMIHYVNFATYVMGMFHGLFSGTDGTAVWAHWYYGISGGTLIGLIVYRVYITLHKKAVSKPKPITEGEHSSKVPTVEGVPVSASAESTPQMQSVPQEASPVENPLPTERPISIPIMAEAISQPVSVDLEQVPVRGYLTAEAQLSDIEEIPSPIKFFDEVPIPPADPILRQRKNPRRNQTQVQAYREPVTVPSRRVLETKSKQSELSPLLLRVKENLSPKSTRNSPMSRPRKKYGIPKN